MTVWPQDTSQALFSAVTRSSLPNISECRHASHNGLAISVVLLRNHLGCRAFDEQTTWRENMLKFIGGTVGFIFLVGLLVVVGILMLIF